MNEMYVGIVKIPVISAAEVKEPIQKKVPVRNMEVPSKICEIKVKGLDEQTLRRLYIDDDLTARVIAEQYNLKAPDIYAMAGIIRRNGIIDFPYKMRKIKYPLPTDFEKFQTLYNKGLRFSDIASVYGVTPVAVASWVARFRRMYPGSLPKREHGEYYKKVAKAMAEIAKAEVKIEAEVKSRNNTEVKGNMVKDTSEEEIETPVVSEPDVQEEEIPAIDMFRKALIEKCILDFTALERTESEIERFINMLSKATTDQLKEMAR